MGGPGRRASEQEERATPGPPRPREVLDRRRAEAESVLLAATAGQPLCRIAEGGDPTEPKYAEGALAAIIELQRTVRSTADGDELTRARSLLAAWEVQQDACAGRGVAWLAYRNGGVAELRNLVAELSAVTDVPATIDR